MQRAYSLLTIKVAAADATGKRTFTGIATTPSTDRMGDIVDPQGAEFELPIPLLWQHDSMQPIGWVTQATATATGIKVEGELTSVDEPGTLKDRLDEAWQSLKSLLVRGLSIGFIGKEVSYMQETGGLHYLKWAWLELSCVTIPANADASIQTVKAADSKQGAVIGRVLPTVKRVAVSPPVATGTPPKTPATTKGSTMNIAERIAALQATRAAKAAQLETLITKGGDSADTMNAEDASAFDALSDEVKAVDAELGRLEIVQRLNVQKAAPVNGGNSREATESRQFATVKQVEKLAPGIEFARFAMCLGAAKGEKAAAMAIAQSHYPNSERINVALKAAVDAGTTTDPNWAGPLLEYQVFAGDFIEFLRPLTILGQFGLNGIPALRSIPFNVHIKGQTSGGSSGWVGEGQPKPLTSFGFSDVYLGFSKLATIAVLTEEAMRFTNPGAEQLVRDALADAIRARMDTDFIDPAKAAVAGVSPASITHGVTPITSLGNSEDDVRSDISALWSQADLSSMPADGAVYIMNASVVRRLAMMRNTLGQRSFPDVRIIGGGFIDGIPIIVSNYVSYTTAGSIVILAFASEIYLADDGKVVIDASREASLQMLDNPTNASPTAVATTMVSMFQTNSVAIRAERYVNWQKRRTQAVSYLTSVNWGE